MTLIKLKYIVSLAHRKHFAYAPAACFVAQPTLSVGIKKLEDGLGITIFERSKIKVTVTSLGSQIISQAKRVLEQPAFIRETALKSCDPLSEHGFFSRLLYDEPFVVFLARTHLLSTQSGIAVQALKQDIVLLLGQGYCFREQVLNFCPSLRHILEQALSLARTFARSSLRTIRHMVASGICLNVLPLSSISSISALDERLSYRPFVNPSPSLRVVIIWRKSFVRLAAIDALCAAVRHCALSGVRYLES